MIFATPDTPEMDFIFTVCDSTAGETCPRWAGRPFTAHWSIEGPVVVEGTEAEKEAAFSTAARYLRNLDCGIPQPHFAIAECAYA
jgi:arsenate reductase